MSPERQDPDLTATERRALTRYLDLQREIVLAKTADLSAGQLAARHPPSTLTLAGLLLHLALVEESWAEERFAGLPSREPWSAVDFDADPDWEFRTAVGQAPQVLQDRYRLAIERSRQVVADASSLDELSVAVLPGEGHFSLRWMLLHLIEETARHAGHVDLLREAVDGAVGE